MLFFFSCTIYTTPQPNPTIEADIQGINHHLQSIELLSNQLREAMELHPEQVEDLREKLQEENNALQRETRILMDHLKADSTSVLSSSHE